MRLPFETRLAEAWQSEVWREVVVLLAVSGGADSVALLRGMANVTADAKARLIVGHFNHGLRAASVDDERFVVELCSSLQLKCVVGHAECDLTQLATGSLEDAARQARYEFLTQIAKQHGARGVVTAHTADDQAETILWRILRGTGLAGLAGMPRTREISPGITLCRPLLSVRRSEVTAYLSQLGQTYREDESNLDQRFTRNRLRHDLLPALAAEYNPHVVPALLRLGQLAAESTAYLEAEAERLIIECSTRHELAAELACQSLLHEPPLLVREILRGLWRRQGWPEQDMSFDKWEELRRLVQSPTSGESQYLNLPGGLRAAKHHDRLQIRRDS